jgi:hypothetical protein
VTSVVPWAKLAEQYDVPPSRAQLRAARLQMRRAELSTALEAARGRTLQRSRDLVAGAALALHSALKSSPLRLPSTCEPRVAAALAMLQDVQRTERSCLAAIPALEAELAKIDLWLSKESTP